MNILIIAGIILGISAVIFLIYTIVPTCYNKVFNRRIVKTTKLKNQVMLTFDDGPDKRYTNSLLDVLKEADIKATFFVVAKNAEVNKDIIERMQTEKHEIALHSLEHKNAMLYGYKYAKKDFSESLSIMKSLGCHVAFYRPPWGHSNIFTAYFAKKHHLKIILWSVMAEDWSAHAKTETIITKLVLRTKNDSVICLHDAGGAPEAPIKTIAALAEVIKLLKAQNYSFITASELS